METNENCIVNQETPWMWGFSTLGCPEKNLQDVSKLALLYGFKAIELRVLEGQMDLPAYFQRLIVSPGETRSLIESAGLSIPVLDTSLRLAKPDSEALAEFIRFAELAESLNVPYLRAFDGGQDCEEASSEIIESVLGTLKWWDDLREERNWSVDLLMETHWAFINPDSCLKLAEARGGRLSLLWDSFHTWRKSGCSPEEVWHKLSPYIKHVHFKDAVKDPLVPKGARLRTIGEGEFPLTKLFNVLLMDNYRGCLCFEWETFWQSDLEPLELQLQKGAQLGFWNRV